MNKDLKLSAGNIKIEPLSGYRVGVSLEDVDVDHILNHITIDEVLNHFPKDEILDEIGEKYVMEYFDLKKEI